MMTAVNRFGGLVTWVLIRRRGGSIVAVLITADFTSGHEMHFPGMKTWVTGKPDLIMISESPSTLDSFVESR